MSKRDRTRDFLWKFCAPATLQWLFEQGAHRQSVTFAFAKNDNPELDYQAPSDCTHRPVGWLSDSAPKHQPTVTFPPNFFGDVE